MINRISLLLVFAFAFVTNAQSHRSLINEGVNLYNEGNYSESEINFRKGAEKKPESFEASFNLGDAFYKQGRYDDAISQYKSALSQTSDNKLKAKTHHNIGNSLLKSQQIKESVEAYKNALKLNPGDADTKYNLSYALSLLNNQDQQQNNQDKNDQNQNDQNDNQDKNDNKNNDQNKDENKKDQNQNRDQNKPEDNKAQQDNTRQQQQNRIPKEEAERILDAIKNNEKDLQKQLRKKEGTPVKTEKDW